MDYQIVDKFETGGLKVTVERPILSDGEAIERKIIATKMLKSISCQKCKNIDKNIDS